jgi:LuxR family maltose regulon positive regulatory protein
MPTDNILRTKFFIPPLHEGMTPRPRLVDIINRNIQKKVLLVSAPAGFGKSTLLSEWAAQAPMPISWLSVDRTENDPINFLIHLISSVRNIYPDVGEASLSTLQAPGSPPIWNICNAWLNEISEFTNNFILILDDFHYIQDRSTIELLTYLTDHQPAQLHLIIASRTSTPSPFSKLRAHGDMIDLGIGDLRFSEAETIAYLRSHMGERISIEEAKILHDRTEGWITALQMAVLSMKSTQNVSKFVAHFSALNRYISDYLMDEVLLQQSEEITNFLLSTSILDEFSPPLCDHILGRQNSQDIINILERSGLFIISLDTTRTWYRYHHLFAELLRKRLVKASHIVRQDLHRKASEWFTQEHMLVESIHHAFSINDYDQVISIIEKSLNQIIAEGLFRNYLSWVESIPKENLKKKPRLEIIKIFMLHEMGRTADRDKQLNQIESSIEPLSDDREGYTPGEIINAGILAAIKAIINASDFFNVDEAIKYSNLADELLQKDQVLWRAMSEGVIPFLNRALGQYEIAVIGFVGILEMILKAQNTFQAMIIYSALTKAYLEMGKLKLAIITCQKAIDLDTRHGSNLPFAKLAYLIMGELMYQAGRLGLAESYIDASLEYVVLHGDVCSIIDGYSTLAHIHLARGDIKQAKDLLQEMKASVVEHSPSGDAKKIMRALDATTSVLANETEKLTGWINTAGFDTLEERYLFDLQSSSYLGIYRVSQTPVKIYSDFLKLTSARAHLALGDLQKSLGLVDELLAKSTEGSQVRYRIESLILKAIILQNMRQMTEAVDIFHHAISIASEEGFSQVFLNEGIAVKQLLETMKEIEHPDVEEQVFILQLLENIHSITRQKENLAGEHPDQLSSREIEVLECLASGTSYSQAAEKLSISRNTLKTHTRRIYQKLGVNGLLQALNKAKEIKVIH